MPRAARAQIGKKITQVLELLVFIIVDNMNLHQSGFKEEPRIRSAQNRIYREIF